MRSSLKKLSKSYQARFTSTKKPILLYLSMFVFILAENIEKEVCRYHLTQKWTLFFRTFASWIRLLDASWSNKVPVDTEEKGDV